MGLFSRFRIKRDRKVPIWRLMLRIFMLIIGIIAGLCLLLFITLKVMIVMGKNSLYNNANSNAPVIAQEETIEVPEEKATVWKEGWVRHNGKVYEYNEDILTFLVLGIDKDTKVSSNKDKVSGGQSDTMLLVVMNEESKKISMISINRDTMVDVTMVGMGENGEDIVSQAQLTVQHGFGDGKEGSCELTRDAVSKLFYDLPIHGYVSINVAAIPSLNDAVGGVEVTIPYDMTAENKKWTEGTVVTLDGKQALSFIRYRDLEVFESARDRLERQKLYLTSLISNVKAETKADITFPVTMYQKLSPYMVTDISIDEVTYLASEALDYDIDSNIYSIKGETVMGEKFEEFYPDKEDIKELMINLFYNEVNLEDFE